MAVPIALVVVAIVVAVDTAVTSVVAVVVVLPVAKLRRVSGGHGEGKDLEQVAELNASCKTLLDLHARRMV